MQYTVRNVERKSPNVDNEHEMTSTKDLRKELIDLQL
jgi:hypothetical protein